jgi:hypothetical protein
MSDDFEKLREGLRAMPVPDARPGFVDRVLTNATSAHRPPRPSRIRAALARPLTWWAAGAGAVAASIAWLVLMSVRTVVPAEPSLTLALHESRDVSLVIDSERDLEGATIRLYVTGSVALAGYEDQHEIQWLASLTQGANLLSLPVVARTPGEGRVVAEIEHDGRTRRVSVAMHVSAPASISFAPARATTQDDIA